MDSNRSTHQITLTVNDKPIGSVMIDYHYLEKHSESMSDALILDLVKSLDGGTFVPVKVTEEYEYYTTEPVEWNGKPYRLIWCLQNGEDYIGVINAFRVKKKKEIKKE